MEINDQMEARIARLEAIEARLRAWTRRAKLVASSAIFLGALIGFVRVALAGNCMAILPSPLTTLCAGAPALAADVNGNFLTLANNLIGKVGPFGSNDSTMNNVTMKSATVSGTINGATLVSTGEVNATANVNAANVVSMGNVVVGGTALVGYQTVQCAGTPCACPNGKAALGGWGDCATGIRYMHVPNGNSWDVSCVSGNPVAVGVVCARLGN